MTAYFIRGTISARVRVGQGYRITGRVLSRADVYGKWGFAVIRGRVVSRTYMVSHLTARHGLLAVETDDPVLFVPYVNHLAGRVRSRVRMGTLRIQFYVGHRCAEFGYVEHALNGWARPRMLLKGFVGDNKQKFGLTHRDGELQHNYYRQQAMNDDLETMRNRAIEAAGILIGMFAVPGVFEAAMLTARAACSLIPPAPCVPNFFPDVRLRTGFLCADAPFEYAGSASLDPLGENYMVRHLYQGKLLDEIQKYYSALFTSGAAQAFRVAYQIIGELRRLCHSSEARNCLIDVSLSVSADSILEAVNGNWTGFVDANVNAPAVLGGVCDLFASLDSRVAAFLDQVNCGERKLDEWRRAVNGEICPESRWNLTWLF